MQASTLTGSLLTGYQLTSHCYGKTVIVEERFLELDRDIQVLLEKNIPKNATEANKYVTKLFLRSVSKFYSKIDTILVVYYELK